MTKFGLQIACEEHRPDALVSAAVGAEKAGFDFVSISDHFHPWNHEQGESPFVWAVIGAIAQATERITVVTAVTCPSVRIHPAINAQAAATAAVMLPDRFVFGVGTGERLNECILGDHWPPAAVRREQLEEAIALMRRLWTGDVVRAYRGKHYTVEHARVFTLPENPPPIVISGFGEQSVKLAGRIGDGYMNVPPDSELLRMFRQSGGDGKPCYAKLDVCVAESDSEARKTAHRLWPNSAIPGEVAQELATPEHFQQACQLIDEDDVAQAALCSSDPEQHVAALEEYLDAGYDHVAIQQYGRDQARLIELYRETVLPAIREKASSSTRVS